MMVMLDFESDFTIFMLVSCTKHCDHRNIRSRMRALSCDRCRNEKQKCPYKSDVGFVRAALHTKVMGRVKFALIKLPF